MLWPQPFPQTDREADSAVPQLAWPQVERRRDPERRKALVRRVRQEFLDMPGLRLTPNQALRLFGLRADVCERVLAELVRDGFLWQTPRGTFARSSEGLTRHYAAR